MTRPEFRFHSRMANHGLIVCVFFGLIAAGLLVLNVSPQTYQIKIAGVEMTASAPGLAFAVLAVLVLWLTRFPKSPATTRPHGGQRGGDMALRSNGQNG